MNFINDLILIINLLIFQFRLIFPYWIIGIIAGSFISVFASVKINNMIGRMNGNRYGMLAVIPAALLGVASPICMYGTIPLIASLGRKGVPQYLLAAFMVSSILLNPNLFIYSFTLGSPIALIRLFTCILAGVMSGLFVKLLFKERKLFNFEGFEERKKRNSNSNIFLKLLSDMHRAIIKTAPYFFIGILLAALFNRYFPKSLILDFFGPNRGFGVLMAASLGIPVYVCGGGTIPLIKSWIDVGMSAGSAMAFMITGPATKITNLSAVKIILGKRNFIIYIAFNIIFAIIIGIIVDAFY
jgi:uncharacterized protein